MVHIEILCIYICFPEDILSKSQHKNSFTEDMEGLFIEIKLRKTKWLIFVSYHPLIQSDQYLFDWIGRFNVTPLCAKAGRKLTTNSQIKIELMSIKRQT